MGMSNSVKFDNDVISYIIEHYTYEPGVRKLKEILFESSSSSLQFFGRS